MFEDHKTNLFFCEKVFESKFVLKTRIKVLASSYTLILRDQPKVGYRKAFLYLNKNLEQKILKGKSPNQPF